MESVLVENNAVTGLKCQNGEIVRAHQVLLATGPWIQKLLRPLGINLPLIVQPIQLNRFRYEVSEMEGPPPFFIDGTAGTFGRPSWPTTVFWVATSSEEVGRVDQFRQPLNIRAAAEAKRRMSKRLKRLRTASLVGGLRAMESYTVDERPYVGYSAKLPNLFIAAGWCCTGFALAPVYAQEITALMKAGPGNSNAKEIVECPQII